MKTLTLSRRTARFAGLLGMLLAAGTAVAQDDSTPNASLQGIVLGTYQAASQSHVDGTPVEDEANGELYLLGTLKMGPGAWSLEVRGSTTPRDNGVTTFYGSNALVGETLDSDGDGRIAATQLFYELPVGPGEFRAGLLDPTALLDGNDVDNDEYTQFMADVFVNNPSIGFPSYVLGGAYDAHITKQLGYKLFLSSDSGLQADGDPTYHNVFDLSGRRDGFDKGAFSAAELDWQGETYNGQAGLWYDTGDVADVDGSDNGEHGYGIYAQGGRAFGQNYLQIRAALANEDALAATNFLGLAFQRAIKVRGHDTVLGVAVARTGDSSKLAFDSDPIYQAEAYWRIHMVRGLYVSPDIQYIDHAQFDAHRDGGVIGGARVGYSF